MLLCGILIEEAAYRVFALCCGRMAARSLRAGASALCGLHCAAGAARGGAVMRPRMSLLLTVLAVTVGAPGAAAATARGVSCSICCGAYVEAGFAGDGWALWGQSSVATMAAQGTLCALENGATEQDWRASESELVGVVVPGTKVDCPSDRVVAPAGQMVATATWGGRSGWDGQWDLRHDSVSAPLVRPFKSTAGSAGYGGVTEERVCFEARAVGAASAEGSGCGYAITPQFAVAPDPPTLLVLLLGGVLLTLKRH